MKYEYQKEFRKLRNRYGVSTKDREQSNKYKNKYKHKCKYRHK